MIAAFRQVVQSGCATGRKLEIIVHGTVRRGRYCRGDGPTPCSRSTEPASTGAPVPRGRLSWWHRVDRDSRRSGLGRRWRSGCARHDRRTGRAGPPARAGGAAAPAGRRSGPMTSVILWGPPGTGKTTIAHLVAQASDRRFVALSALNAGREGRPCGDRRGPPGAPHGRRGDGAVHRRGAPVLQDPAGLPALRGRGRHGHTARGDHGEPVLLE